MKYTTLVLSAAISVIMVAPANAQTTVKLNLEKATVFLTGAQLESSARLSLVKGENEIRFTNVAGDVNKESIIISAGKEVVVESVTTQNNHLANDNISPKVKQIKDSVERINAQKLQVTNKIAVLAEQIYVMQSNREVKGNNISLSTPELQKLLDFVGVKYEHYLNEKSKNEELLKKLDERIANLNRQLAEEQMKEYQPGGLLIVKFYVKDAINSTVNVTYNVAQAGWTPSYDVLADDTKGPVKFVYKALLFQNTGVKWNNVRLSLSTGNPQQGMQAPVLEPWYLAFYNPILANAAPMATYKWQADTVEVEDVDGTALKKIIKHEEPSTMNAYVAVNNTGVNTTFDIDLPYTIPSDGQNHLVAIKKYDVPASYEYIAVPKRDDDAFLQANITNWEDFNMLPGQTNIFFEGTYLGQGAIDMSNIKDTLSLSLGRDKKIIVKREQDKKLRSVKTIGTNVREKFAYTITVRNTRKEAVTIVVQDQQPVSNDKDIVLEDQETNGAEYNETTGLMKWRITLKPNETKSIPFSYTLKYPRGKRVEGL